MQRVVLSWVTFVALIVVGSNDASAAGKAPRISGSPPQAVSQNTRYEFRPTATDAERDRLTFSIARKPGWAAFDTKTGRLSGTPRQADAGVYTNIRISVSDGSKTASLPNFGISVTQSASGSVTLSWLPPTTNADGSTLRDLAGYRIYVGQSANALNRVIVLNNSGLSRYVVEDLAPARWHFAVTSVNARGRESQRSATVSKVVG